jgi:trk system potassium uptake protein TrkH
MIYLMLTAVLVILLTAGGMNLFDSICHSFGTVATGGFSTKNTSIAGYSGYIQYVLGVFMFPLCYQLRGLLFYSENAISPG